MSEARSGTQRYHGFISHTGFSLEWGEQLGHGTYGNVHQSTLINVDGSTTNVAVKNSSPTDELCDCSFLVEACSLARLNSQSSQPASARPHIISLVDVIFDEVNTNKIARLITPLAKCDLYSYIQNTRQTDQALSLKEIKHIFFSLLQTISFVHSCGLLHGDLKPENVLLYPRDGEIRFHAVLCDFGLCRPREVYSDSSIWEAMTPWYRSPELTLGDIYRESSDVWALGCILFNMIKGVSLFPCCSERDRMQMYCDRLGIPTEETWPGVTSLPRWSELTNNLSYHVYSSLESVVDLPPDDATTILLAKMLTLCPSHRVDIPTIMTDPFFDEVRSDFESIPRLVVSPSINVDRIRQMLPQKQRALFYNWLQIRQRRHDRDHRIQCVTINILERFMSSPQIPVSFFDGGDEISRTGWESRDLGSRDSQPTSRTAMIYGLASLSLSFFLLSYNPTYEHDLLRHLSMPILQSELHTAQKHILREIGFNLYPEESRYDHFKRIVNDVFTSDQQKERDIAWTLFRLTYLTDLGLEPTEKVNSFCLAMTCEVTETDVSAQNIRSGNSSELDVIRQSFRQELIDLPLEMIINAQYGACDSVALVKKL